MMSRPCFDRFAAAMFRQFFDRFATAMFRPFFGRFATVMFRPFLRMSFGLFFTEQGWSSYEGGVLSRHVRTAIMRHLKAILNSI